MTDDRPRDSSYRREIFSTVLLSLATLGSTWSAYQSSCWSGLQATRFSEASTARTSSEGAGTRAVQLTSFDGSMFIQYVAELGEGHQFVAQFLYQRFRPEMKVAVDAWLATKPLTNAAAPPSPFAMPVYKLEAARKGHDLAEVADQKFEAARHANGVSDKYVLLTVIFTSVLFFAGVGEKLWSPAATRILLAVGTLLFLAAAVALSRLPRQ